jgi:hypothetical protein
MINGCRRNQKICTIAAPNLQPTVALPRPDATATDRTGPRCLRPSRTLTPPNTATPSMLPQDLAFTVFVPSQRAFERDLRLRVKDSLVGEKMNDTVRSSF